MEGISESELEDMIIKLHTLPPVYGSGTDLPAGYHCVLQRVDQMRLIQMLTEFGTLKFYPSVKGDTVG